MCLICNVSNSYQVNYFSVLAGGTQKVNSVIKSISRECAQTIGNPAFLAEDAEVSEDMEVTETSSEATDEDRDCHRY